MALEECKNFFFKPQPFPEGQGVLLDWREAVSRKVLQKVLIAFSLNHGFNCVEISASQRRTLCRRDVAATGRWCSGMMRAHESSRCAEWRRCWHFNTGQDISASHELCGAETVCLAVRRVVTCLALRYRQLPDLQRLTEKVYMNLTFTRRTFCRGALCLPLLYRICRVAKPRLAPGSAAQDAAESASSIATANRAARKMPSCRWLSPGLDLPVTGQRGAHDSREFRKNGQTNLTPRWLWTRSAKHVEIGGGTMDSIPN